MLSLAMTRFVQHCTLEDEQFLKRRHGKPNSFATISVFEENIAEFMLIEMSTLFIHDETKKVFPAAKPF